LRSMKPLKSPHPCESRVPPTRPDHPVQSATAVRPNALRRRTALLGIIAIAIFLGDLAVAALLHFLLPSTLLLSHHLVDALAVSALLLPVIVWSLRKNSDCSTLQRRHDALSIQTAEFERLAMVAQRTTNAVVITDADYGGNRTLYLVHDHDGRDLLLDYAERTLQHLHRLWGREVALESFVNGKKVLLTYSDQGFGNKPVK